MQVERRDVGAPEDLFVRELKDDGDYTSARLNTALVTQLRTGRSPRLTDVDPAVRLVHLIEGELTGGDYDSRLDPEEVGEVLRCLDAVLGRLDVVGVPVRTLSPAANGGGQSSDLEGRGSSAVLVASASARRPPLSSGT